MGIGPNGTNFAKIGGVSTPMVVSQVMRPTVRPVSKATPPIKASVGSNAQTDQMARTMQKTSKVQQTYGVPGAK